MRRPELLIPASSLEVLKIAVIYDYMLVNSEKYLPVNTEGNSVFEVPVEALDAPLTMIGDTVAMSTPHEVEYTVTFHSDTLQNAESGK